jgi:cell wall-associated NlpC family hydrolase
VAAATLALALGLPAVPAYAAGPSPSPTATPSDIAAAKAKAAKVAAKLSALTSELKATQAELDATSAQAELAVAQWQAAQAQVAAANDAATTAQNEAFAAEINLANYRAQLNAYAIAAYMDGGPIADLAALLTATNPADVLTRNATLQAVGIGQSQIVHDFVTASVQAANAQAAAAQASRDADRALADAQSARTTAEQSVAVAQSLLAKVQQARNAIAAAAGKQNATVADLVKQHEASLAAAQKAAARVATERLRSLAPVVGYTEATPAQGRLALQWAKTQLGVAYSWGGGDAFGPTLGFAESDGTTAGLHTIGFDCSGLTLFAWAHAGYSLQHWTGAQWVEGVAVAKNQLRPGDLLFFATDVTDPSTIHHVGIYAGGGTMIDAPQTGSVVRYDPAFNGQYIGAVRP